MISHPIRRRHFLQSAVGAVCAAGWADRSSSRPTIRTSSPGPTANSATGPPIAPTFRWTMPSGSAIRPGPLNTRG